MNVRKCLIGGLVLASTVCQLSTLAQAKSANTRVYNTKPWVKEMYPNPDQRANQCRTIKSFRFCDPDRVLSDDQVDQVEDALMTTQFRRVTLPCAPEGPPAEVQMAVALTGQVRVFVCYCCCSSSIRVASCCCWRLYDR
jgi:Modulator of levamisole receptor-1